MESTRVPADAPPAHYKIGVRPDKAALAAPVADVEDLPAVEECLRLAARALRQYRTYPPTSPLCTDAIAAWDKALKGLHGRDRLVVRVTPRELFVDEHGLGAGTVMEHELVTRLHRARVLSLEIDRAATSRELSRFCSDLLRSDGLPGHATLAELLVEHGVDTIAVQMAYRPEVLEVGAPAESRCRLVEHEQDRRQQALVPGGAVEYLYPRDKGWVRVDPSTPLHAVSLTDLAVLLEDPTDLATALLRLTDEPVKADDGPTPLERKFSDVTNLFSALDPALARLMFARLASAVLALNPEHRKGLLQRTILPGLLDGQADGAVLRDFPDDDLADALCLLLELDTAAPEVLNAAVARLDLPTERREAVLPLIDERLRQGRDGDGAPADGERSLDRLAKRLIRVEASAAKDFSEFSAFDLSIDEAATGGITALCGSIGATDASAARLQSLASIVRLQPNPKEANALMHRALPLLAELFDERRWTELATRVSWFRALAAELREDRPDVADVIVATLTQALGASRTAALLALHKDANTGRTAAAALVDAFGLAAAPPLCALLDRPGTDSQTAVLLMCDHAVLLGPALLPQLSDAPLPRRRALVRILGFAGAGYETAIAGQLDANDEALGKEALRALARIGTGHAAALVARELQSGPASLRSAAEESLWHFPPARVAWQLRQLLGSRDFVVHHPKTAARLLDRAVQAGTRGLEEVVSGLERLRFRFWSPGLMRVAHKARELRPR